MDENLSHYGFFIFSFLLDAASYRNGNVSFKLHVSKYFILNYKTKAQEALAAGEVPVGCVFVKHNKIIAKARNRTNELHNVCFFF
jgi:hypothetical protein